MKIYILETQFSICQMNIIAQSKSYAFVIGLSKRSRFCISIFHDPIRLFFVIFKILSF